MDAVNIDDDIFCLIQPWGFDVTEIRVPTRICTA